MGAPMFPGVDAARREAERRAALNEACAATTPETVDGDLAEMIAQVDTMIYAFATREGQSVPDARREAILRGLRRTIGSVRLALSAVRS